MLITSEVTNSTKITFVIRVVIRSATTNITTTEVTSTIAIPVFPFQ